MAKWPFAVLAVAIVIGGGVFAVMWGSDSLGNADASDGECTEGRRTLRIIAPTRLVEPLVTVGDKWNAIDRVVDGHCVSVEVNGANEDKAMDAISRQDGGVLAVPAVWIAESSDAGERLTESNPKRVATLDTPLRTTVGYLLPYVVIDGTGVDAVQQRAAQEFRDYLSEPEPLAVLKKSGFGA